MQFILSTILASLVKIFMKLLMNAAGEKQLAKILFTTLSYFASKTATNKDDALVVWAKDLYFDEGELDHEVMEYEQMAASEPLMKP